MAVLNEQATLGDVLFAEWHREYCREDVTLASGINYKIGHVLGKVTADGKYTLADPAATNGSETAVAILLETVDATITDKTGSVLVDIAIVKRGGLSFKDGVNSTQQAAFEADLAARNIKVRQEV